MNILVVIADGEQRRAWESLVAEWGHVPRCPEFAQAVTSSTAVGFPLVIVAGDSATAAFCREIRQPGEAVPTILAVAEDDDGALALAEAGASHVIAAGASAARRRAALVLALRTAALGERASAAETRVNDMVEDANDLIYTHDLQGVITSGNRATEAVTGYQPHELIGLSISVLVAPEHLAGALEMTRRKLSGDASQTAYELDIIRKDGSRIPLEVSTRVIYKDSRPVAVQGIGRDVSERKRGEADIARLAAIVDSAEDAIILRDLDGRVTVWNAGAERVFGYTAEEVLGRTLEFLEPAAAAGQLAAALRRQVAGESVHIAETRRLTRDGREIDISVDLFPVRNGAGEVIAVAGIGRDITLRKQADATIARQLGEMRALYNLGAALQRASSIDDALEAGLDALTAIFGESRASARTTDHATGALRFRARRGVSEEYCRTAEALHPTHSPRAPLQPMIHRDLRKAGVLDGYRTALGKEGIGAALSVPLSATGAELGVLTVYANEPRDWPAPEIELAETIAATVGMAIQRLETETALRESEARTRLIIDTALDAVITIDADGAITAWNAQAEAIFGWPAREAMGRELAATIIRPGDREPHREGLRHFLQTGEAHILGRRRQVIAMRRDGSEFPAELAVTPIVSASGETGFSAFIRDITERERAAQALRVSETNYRTIFESNSDGIHVMDRGADGEFRCTAANSAYYAMMGSTPEAVIGKTLLETVADPERAASVQADYAEAMRSRRPVQWERSANGRHSISQVTPVFNSDGECVRFIANFHDMTEVREAEAALRESEAHYRAVFANIADGLYVMERGADGQFRCTMVNEAYCRIFQRTPEMVLNKTVEESLGTGAGAVVLGHFAQAIAVRGPIQWEWSRDDETGGRLHAIIQLTPLFDATGLCYRLLGSLREVTSLKEVEAARQEVATRLQMVAENAPIVLFALDRQGVFTLSEGRGLERLGLRPGEVVGMHVDDLYASNPAILRDIQRALAGESFATVAEVEGAAFDTFFSPLLDATGAVVGTIGVSVDVTDRRRAEAMASRLGRLLDDSTGEIYVVDAATLRVVQANRGARENLGFSEEELLAMAAPDLNPEFNPEGWRRFVAPLLAGTEETVHAETTMHRKDGSVYPADVRLSLSGNETPPVYLAVVQDITERKRQEEALLQSQKLESLGVLAGGIAHDFNNLLVGILGNAGLALMDLPPASPARETLQQIEIAGKHAADLARQMLAYSGKGRFIIQPVNLNSLVKEMTQLLGVSIHKGVNLHYDLAIGLPAVDADITQLRQVVMNLVVNASDAIGQESGIITIATEVVQATREDLASAYLSPDLPAGDYVSLSIRDSGSGMDAETRSKIFDPFFTTKFTGRGLGLAAVLGIVRGHHGAIRVESSPGRGSAFTLLLPRAAGEPEAAPGSGASEAEWRLSGSILVVDDEDTVRRVTARALSILGLSVLTAANGFEAVDMFREHHREIRCTLLDMTMPGMDGEATFRALREIDPAALVVLMSGYTEQDATGHFTSGGLAGFIQKPYEIATLRDVVRQVIESAL